jgi:CoA:oxalate CoA-transferase
LVRSPIRIGGYDPDYRPPPLLDQHGDVAAQSS